MLPGDGMNMNGGQVDRTLRSALCSLVLAGERDLAVEVASITDRNDDLTSKYAVYRFDSHSFSFFIIARSSFLYTAVVLVC